MSIFGPVIFPLKWLDAFSRQTLIEMHQSASEFLDQSRLPVNRLSAPNRPIFLRVKPANQRLVDV